MGLMLCPAAWTLANPLAHSKAMPALRGTSGGAGSRQHLCVRGRRNRGLLLVLELFEGQIGQISTPGPLLFTFLARAG